MAHEFPPRETPAGDQGQCFHRHREELAQPADRYQAGGCCVLMDRRDAAGIAKWIRDERITVWNAVPPQLRDMVRNNDIKPAELASLTDIWCGGTDLSETVRAEFETKFAVPVRNTYGLTEAPAVVAIDPPDDQRRPGASGVVVPHLDVGSVDGELTVSAAMSGPWARRYTPMLGYWIDGCVETAVSPLHTGDLGFVDDGGWVRVTGRRKLVIVRGGANVYPSEVEDVIRTVRGVGDAVVFGLPDDRLGERVAALIEREDASESSDDAPDAASLRRHCGPLLAAYKIPDVWAIVDSLPRNSMGKVVRTDLPALLQTARRLEVAPAARA